jgi:CBS domain-containing protein
VIASHGTNVMSAGAILLRMDVASFLRRYPPFDDLPDDRLDEIVRHTQIEFRPQGDVILRQGGEPATYMFVVRTGAVELLDEEHVMDLLLEGEVFGHPSLLSGLSPTLTCRAHDDTILYLIEREQAEAVLSTHSGLAFLSSSLRRRVTRALDGLNPTALDPWQTPVGGLVRRPPVIAPVTYSVREAAELMTQERVSSLIVDLGSGLGIMTDRDLRSRVLAAGLSPDTHIGEVLTSPVITVPEQAMVAEVTALMLETGAHHIPVVDGEGTMLGMVTDMDLIALEMKTPFSLKVDIERAATADEVVEVAGRLEGSVRTLVEANVDPLAVGHTIAVTIDALTRQLLELGIAKHGDPPCPWAWLALGSEARMEQGLRTDQDNALVIDPGDAPLAEVDPYFQQLASFVNEQLELAGVPRCKAGVIASNRKWRNTPDGWEKTFRTWIDERSWLTGAFAAIAFDYRQVAGPLDVQAPFDRIIRAASGAQRFVRRLGATALEDRAPTGFLQDLVVRSKGETASMLDVKGGGITLITNLARVYSILCGLSENRTLRRLHEVAALGKLEANTEQGLEEAFRLLWQIRLEHQVSRVQVGAEPDDLVDPRALGPLARQGLKEAFRIIDVAQDQLANVLGVGR